MRRSSPMLAARLSPIASSISSRSSTSLSPSSYSMTQESCCSSSTAPCCSSSSSSCPLAPTTRAESTCAHLPRVYAMAVPSYDSPSTWRRTRTPTHSCEPFPSAPSGNVSAVLAHGPAPSPASVSACVAAAAASAARSALRSATSALCAERSSMRFSSDEKMRLSELLASADEAPIAKRPHVPSLRSTKSCPAAAALLLSSAEGTCGSSQ
mmetsp:Transcript_50035/g.115477  ORF Transcript_50035/g.115477 Transcript_50035/m.115477 type:complete len:210 (-) Transcript_50035:39-668(-)